MKKFKILLRKTRSIFQKIENVENNFSNIECQTDSGPKIETEQQISNLNRENVELLSDMNEMDQEFGEQGENISKLQALCKETAGL